MISPTLAQARAIDASSFRLIPLSLEMYSDSITPVELLRKLRLVSDHCFILESCEDSKNWGRYTFLGFDPTMLVTCRDGQMTISGDSEKTFHTTDPSREIQGILDEHASARFEGLPPFTGGLVGYFSYDYARYTEPTLKRDNSGANYPDEPAGDAFPDVDLMLFDKVIVFDNLRQKIILIVNIATDDLDASYAEGVRQLHRLQELIGSGRPADIAPVHVTSPFRGVMTEPQFSEMVDRAKHHITEGDIFQVVLSNRFDADFEGSIFDVYRVLRTINPSPYMFFLTGTDVEIAGASPETLIKLQDGRLYTFPLAGSRPRGASDTEDAMLEAELLADEKELAEHNMLVDLGRNDLGKIAEIGSVTVDQYMSILKFSHIMHIGSTVSARIREGKTGVDAIEAVLPAGTLSGAPKIRAMQIIDDLEPTRRGIYGGAIGYLDFTGNMDMCIAIRIAYHKNGRVFVRSGAGIVADSDPASEYRECANKSKAVMTAFEQAEGGLDK